MDIEVADEIGFPAVFIMVYGFIVGAVITMAGCTAGPLAPRSGWFRNCTN